MKSLSGVGIGLSLVFGCLFLALIAELYYLLWWKNRITNGRNEDGYSTSTTEFFYKFCWTKPSSSLGTSAQEFCSSEAIVHEPEAQIHSNPNKDLRLKPFGENCLESDMTRFPRFLFTIAEETREDLECENGSRKQSTRRTLSDLLQIIVETPFLTPMASPSYFTPPLTPSDFNQKGFFNPFLESQSDAMFNRLRSSPPPKLKFLRDAEEKLFKRRAIEEAEKSDAHEENGSFFSCHFAGVVLSPVPVSSGHRLP